MVTEQVAEDPPWGGWGRGRVGGQLRTMVGGGEDDFGAGGLESLLRIFFNALTPCRSRQDLEKARNIVILVEANIFIYFALGSKTSIFNNYMIYYQL